MIELKSVCVIGMGFVGLTLSVVMAEKDIPRIVGVETNPETLKQLKSGKPHFFEAGLPEALQKHQGRSLTFSNSVPTQVMDAYVITVGTPIDKTTNLPVLDQIKTATQQVAQKIENNCLVVLRSTVSVGTTRNIVYPILKKTGKKFFLAFCPERTIEGKALQESQELPQIIGGYDSESAQKAVELFSKITTETVVLSSLESAEMVKLLNNSWRDTTFAFANEISHICEKQSLDANEIIHAANYKYSRSAIPSPGFSASKVPRGGFVGGFCLRKDPHILIDVGKKNGIELGLIKTARQINENLPRHVAKRIASELNDPSKKIFLLGFAFKGEPETDDIRDSPTIELVQAFQTMGYHNLYGHDFLVPFEKIKSLGVTPTALSEGFKNASAVCFCTSTKRYQQIPLQDLIPLMTPRGIFFDTWRLFDKNNPVFGNSEKKYQSVGL